MTKSKVELITDSDHLLFAEKCVRGGYSAIIHRHATANNIFMGDKFNKEKESNFILYTDCVNLYGKCYLH